MPWLLTLYTLFQIARLTFNIILIGTGYTNNCLASWLNTPYYILVYISYENDLI